MPTDPPPRKDSYVVDAESPTEMVRLMKQDRLLTRFMGGVCSERPDLSDMSDILDLACGPGGWVLEVAFHYPKCNVAGVDISNLVVDYARAQAWTQGLNNASFRTMNILEGLDFPDDAFDMVNARLMCGFMPRTAWPGLLQECMRITRPGGIIRLTEAETNFATTPAFQKLAVHIATAIKMVGLSFSTDGYQLNITPKLGRLLRDAGYVDIGRKAYALDYSTQEEAHYSLTEDVLIGFQLAQPLLTKLGLVTNDEFDQLFQQAQIEIRSDEFCALWFLLTTWGYKPKAGESA